MDAGVYFRRPRIEQRKAPGEPGRTIGGGDDLLSRRLESWETMASLVLNHHLEAAGAADATHRWWRDYDDESVLDDGETLAQRGEYALGAQALARPLRKRCHGDEDRAGIGGIGEGRAIEAGERHDMRDAFGLPDELCGAPDERVSPRERRAGRELEEGDEIALILLGDEAGRGAAELPAGQCDEAGVDDQHQHGDANEPHRQRGVAGRQPLETAIEAAEEGARRADQQRAACRLFLVRLEEKRAERRAQRQRDEAGDDRRRCDRCRELPEELPEMPGMKAEGMNTPDNTKAIATKAAPTPA